MRGLDLARAYYEEVGRPALVSSFPVLAGRWAAGLVGEGSECFGFDDEISRDHDWGPGFCLWLTDEQSALYGGEMQKVYERLPRTYKGFERTETALAGKRHGVFGIREFYGRFLGGRLAPESNMEWLSIPETYLAVATNGAVFEDGAGEFSKIRDKLLTFYPEDVRRKKIAARIAVMAREGQYNYPRCQKRGDAVAALQALSQFMDAAISVIYLLKKKYAPYYKWAFRGLERWPEFDHYRELLITLAKKPDQETIEAIACEVIQELRRQGLTESSDSFLQAHCADVLRGIADSQIRNRHLLEG